MSTEEKRVDLFLQLLKEEEWSFGMIVITALDRLQHKLIGKGEHERKQAIRGYREVDRLVGKIADSVGSGVNLLVTSDHGFNDTPVAFYPNTWLYQRGLLQRKSPLPRRVTRGLHDMLDGHLLWLPQGLTKRYQGAQEVVRSIDAVDLEKSRAFVPGTDGVIVVRSREDEESIVAGLTELKDDSGEQICKVYPRDQIYKGEKLGSAPQLLIVPRGDVNIKTDPFSRSVISRSGDFPKGNHGPDGIFLARGPDIRKSAGLDLSLEDVAPTSLSLMGISPPESMDGRVVHEILVEPKTPDLLEKVQAAAGSEPYAFSAEDEKSVLDNLKRLGYG